ncbi:MAG TPA: phosphatase domain-containing protein [Thermoanaerobaculia bacterium]
MSPRRIIHGLANRIDRRLDRRRRDFGDSHLAIHPYFGFGRGHELHLRGRVLVENNVSRAREAAPVWRNVLDTYRRFASDEVANERVIARYRDVFVETRTDAEGYFQVRLQPDVIDAEQLWHDVGLELPDRNVAAVGKVIVPGPAPDFGVISDVDDTIVQTGATSVLRMVRSILLQNAAMRPPFEGVADLYAALHKDRNPIFYVSSSPWNLYDLIHDFMDLNRIPHGPMFLQDWGIDDQTLITAEHETHKLAQIQLLLEFYPEMPFILIGDSGQHDPEIYLQVIRTHGARVKAAFIRDVTPDLRDQGVAGIISEAKTHNVEMLYVRDSAEALQHAKRLGFI